MRRSKDPGEDQSRGEKMVPEADPGGSKDDPKATKDSKQPEEAVSSKSSKPKSKDPQRPLQRPKALEELEEKQKMMKEAAEDNDIFTDPKEVPVSDDDEEDSKKSDESRRSRLTARKQISRKSPLFQGTKKRIAKRLEFSPGPSQVKTSVFMERMKSDIETFIKREMMKTQEAQKPSLANDLFPKEEQGNHADKEFRKRMESLIEADEKRQVELQNKRLEEIQKSQKKEWSEEQQKIRQLQQQLQDEKNRNETLQRRCEEMSWQEQYHNQHQSEGKEDDLQQWYEEEEPPKEVMKAEQVSKSEDSGSSPYTVIPPSKDGKDQVTNLRKAEESQDPTVKDLLKMMMQQHEATLKTFERITSPEKASDEDKREWQEEVKVRPITLEVLGEASDGNAAIKCGDWIHRITPQIVNLSRRTNEFWTRSLEVVKNRYEEHLKCSPIERLTKEYPIEEIEVDPKYEKIRPIITEMLLKAIPKELASEAITKRLDNPTKILLLIMVKYQPGGRKEREALLSQITNPESCWSDDKALEGIRVWKRRLQRAKELKLVIPDPAVLLSALDHITEGTVRSDARKTFRIETLREQLKVDIVPSYEAVEKVTTFIEAELEESVSTTLKPKIKTLQPKGAKGGKNQDDQKPSTKGDPKGTKGKDESKGKGKTHTKEKGEPCKYFTLEDGCRFGQTCRAYHRILKPEERKCYICGSSKHQASECDRPKRDPSKAYAKGEAPKKGKPKGYSSYSEGNGKGKPSIKQLSTEEEQPKEKPDRELKPSSSDPKEPEREPDKAEKVIEAFQTMMIKALREKSEAQGSGDAIDNIIGSLQKKLDVNIKVIKVKKVLSDRRYGLLDSGATNNAREAKEDEDLEGVVPIDVEVAFEGSVNTRLFMTPEGTILGPKGTEAIVSMNLLVEELGYSISWESGSLEIFKEDEALPVEVINGTPMLKHEVCLDLISQIEARRKARMKSIKMTTGRKSFKIDSIWPQLKELITWLITNNIKKGIELLNVCIRRRKQELQEESKEVEHQQNLMLEQVSNRKDQVSKKILIEVCCYEKSRMSTYFQERGGGAIRLGLPKHDLSEKATVEAVKACAKELKSEGFEVILWISIPCGPWCSWQRVNLATIEDYQNILQKKREDSLVLVKAVKNILEESKAEAYFEWPSKNDGWKQAEVEDLMKILPYEAEVDGCAYDLKASDGRPMKKTWKIKSNNQKVEEYLHRRCEGHKDHAQVRGKDAKKSENYTDAFVEEVMKCMFREKQRPVMKPMRKGLSFKELDDHQQRGHFPFDGRCKDCQLGGIKDRRHFRKAKGEREENILAVDVAGRFKEGVGPEGSGYKYLLVSTFNASKKKWKDLEDSPEEPQSEALESAEEILRDSEPIIIKMIRPKDSKDKERTSREVQQEAVQRIAEHRVKVLRNSLVKAVAEKPIQVDEEEQRTVPVNLEESENSSESSSSYSVQEEDKDFRFIHFDYLPSNLQKFREMREHWYGFEKAMKYINLDVKLVENQLKEGKKIYYDREEMQDRIRRAYEVYLSTEPKIIKRIHVPTEEDIKKLVAMTTPKAKVRKSKLKYPYNALESFRRKCIKNRKKKVCEEQVKKIKERRIKALEEMRKNEEKGKGQGTSSSSKASPSSVQVCVQECTVQVERKGKLVPCGRTCSINEVHSTTTCKCKLHLTNIEQQTTKKESKTVQQQPKKTAVQLSPKEPQVHLTPYEEVSSTVKLVEKREVKRQRKKEKKHRRAEEATSSRRVILSEDTRPFSFTSEEEQLIKDAYKDEEEERKRRERTASIKVIRIKPSKVSQATSSIEDRRQKGENEDEVAEEESTAEFDLFADYKELAEEDSDPEFGRNPFGFDLEEEEVTAEEVTAEDQIEETEEVEDQSQQIDLKKTMIFVTPLKSKASGEVELAIKEIVLYIQRKLKYKVERIHSDPGTELNTKRMREWCADNSIRRTSSVPEDPKGNGSAEAGVGLIKRQIRAIIQEAGIDIKYWPFAANYAAKQREKYSIGEEPLLKFGAKVIVKKRVSNNRKIKGFETIGRTARYLGIINDTSEGHYVLLEDEEGKVMKTTRIVPYDEKERDEEEQDLKEAGWIWLTDPDGRVFFLNKDTGEKSWNHPLRVEVQPEESSEEDRKLSFEERKRLYGKQRPPKTFMKGIRADQGNEDDEDVEDEENEVTKTINLQEVYQNLQQWTPSMKDELNSQYLKGCLVPRTIEEIRVIKEETGVKVKLLPSKLVATKKKKPLAPQKLKARLVACGNLDEEKGEKETYAGGADATAVRCAIRRAALKGWQIRTKDVSTAFLNAPYKVEGEALFLIPPKVFIKAGLISENEVWEVKMAIYGLQESPLLWAKERDRRLTELSLKIEEDEYSLKRFETDVNTWHITRKGDTKEAKGLLLTYVDDIMVLSEEKIAEEFMKKIDDIWKCSPEEVVKEGHPAVNFCGICIEKISKGYAIHQKPYIKELLKKHRLEDCTSTKILLDKESEHTIEEVEETEEYQEWKKSPEFLQYVRRGQQIAGEVLWLSTRTRPDLCYPIQKMTSAATKDPKKALTIGTRILRYLKGTKDYGILYTTKEEAERRFEECKEDWPKEAIDESRVTVWTDSSFASQEGAKSQGALVVTQSMSPIFWKCGTQNLVSQSTAESELQMLVEGSLAAQNIGLLMKEVIRIPNHIEEKKESIKELQERQEFNVDEQEEVDDEAKDLLCIDNKAATQILLQEGGSWRTRHLRVRAAALKQRIEAGQQKVVHVPGRSMLADLNTKSHPFGRLQQLRKLWGIEEITSTPKTNEEDLIGRPQIKALRIPKQNNTKEPKETVTIQGEELEELKSKIEKKMQEEKESQAEKQSQEEAEERKRKILRSFEEPISHPCYCFQYCGSDSEETRTRICTHRCMLDKGHNGPHKCIHHATDEELGLEDHQINEVVERTLRGVREAQQEQNNVRIKMMRIQNPPIPEGQEEDEESSDDEFYAENLTELEEGIQKVEKNLERLEEVSKARMNHILSQREATSLESHRFYHELMLIERRRTEVWRQGYKRQKALNEKFQEEMNQLLDELSKASKSGGESSKSSKTDERSSEVKPDTPKRPKAPPPTLPEEPIKKSYKVPPPSIGDPPTPKVVQQPTPVVSIPQSSGSSTAQSSNWIPPAPRTPPPRTPPPVAKQGVYVYQESVPKAETARPVQQTGEGQGFSKWDQIPPKPTRPPPISPVKDEEKRKEKQKELAEIEAAEQRRKELARKTYNEQGQKLLSYDEGFDWCPNCKHVSLVSKISQLKFSGLRGCQRRVCEGCTQWTWESPYEPEDFFYEGEKDETNCPFYMNGKGCPKGNKCDLKHPKFDITLKENKIRCFVCGERNDHISTYCERPGGMNYQSQFPQFGVEEGRTVIIREFPRRPNGERPRTNIVSEYTSPEEERQNEARRNEERRERFRKEEEERRETIRKEEEKETFNKRALTFMSRARLEIATYGKVTDTLRAAMLDLAFKEVDFKQKSKLVDFIEDIETEERIAEIHRQTDEDVRRSTQAQLEPRLKAIKVLNVELEDNENEELRFLKTVFLVVAGQAVANWIYSKCQRRNRTVVSTEGTDEDPNCETSSEEEDENPRTKEKHPEEKEKQRSQKSEENNDVIYITRNGERFHVNKDCVHLKKYMHHPRSPCELCKSATQAIIEGRVSSSSQEDSNVIYLSLKDQKYHHEDCPKIGTKQKDKRSRCKDCCKSKKSKIYEDEEKKTKGLESKTHCE